MNRAALAIFACLIVLACSPSKAQTNAEPNGRITLATGSTIAAELGTTIDSKKAKPGDAVMAYVTETLKAGGTTVIPKGAKIVGHVTEASARAKGDANSTLGIQFEKVTAKNGPEIPLNVWIRAIAAPPEHVPEAGPGQDSITADSPGMAAGSPMGVARNGTSGANSNPRTAAGTPNGSPIGASSAENSPANAAGSAPGNVGGLNPAGQLSANSRGVFGLTGLHLATDASSAPQGSLITTSGKNVRLESGTRLLLVSQLEDLAAPKN